MSPNYKINAEGTRAGWDCQLNGRWQRGRKWNYAVGARVSSTVPAFNVFWCIIKLHPTKFKWISLDWCRNIKYLQQLLLLQYEQLFFQNWTDI